MNNILKFFSIIFLVFLFSFSNAADFAWESEFVKVEKDYLKGDYKVAVKRSKGLLKKIENKLGNENFIYAKGLAQLAKIYVAFGGFKDYQTTIDRCVKIIELAPKEDTNEYARVLRDIAEVYLQYGDYSKAQEIIEKANKLVEEGKLKDAVIISDIKFKTAQIYYHQGYLLKAEAMVQDIISYRKARVVKKEAYTDDKGRTKDRKLTKDETEKRIRAVVEVINLYPLISMGNGDYIKSDSLIHANSSYIRKNLSKKDITAMENLFQKGLLLEILQKHSEANIKFEKAAKMSLGTKGIRLKPMSKEAIRVQEKIIISHKRVKRDQQAKKREKIFETRVRRYYGENSIYFAKDLLTEAEGSIFAKEYKKAESRVMQVLNNAAYFPRYHTERVRALKILYLISMETDQYVKAEESLEQISDIRKNINGEKTPAFQLAKLDQADFYVSYSSKFKSAEDIYKSILGKIDNEIDHRQKHYLGYLLSFSLLYEYTDRFEKSLEILNKALNDMKAYYGENHPKYATVLERIANIYIDMGRYADAEKNLNRSSEIFKKQGSAEDNKDYSHALETYARLYIIQGEYDDAKKMLKKSMSKQGSDEAKLSGAIEELATLYIETGKYQATEKSLKETIKIKEAKYGPVHRTLVNPLNQLGHLYLITGDYTQAEKLTRRAAAISVQIFGDTSIKYAESLKLLGDIYSSIGDYEKAEEVEEKALEIQKHQYGKKHIQVAASLNDIALVKYYNNASKEAVENLLQEALNLTKENLSENHPRYASILNNLALFYLETGKIEKSEKFLDQSNAIWVKKFGESNIHSAEIYFIKGNVAYKKGEYEAAKLHYITSKSIYEKIFDNSHPGYINAVSKIGQMYYITGDYKNAIKSLNETTTHYLAFIKKYFPSLSEREKTKFWKKIQNDFEFYNTLAVRLKETNPELISNAYNFALSTKALLLSSSIKVRTRILASNDADLIKKYEDWVAKKEFLTSAISMSIEQRKENEIDLKSLESEIENLEKELSSKSEIFAKSYKKENYDWKDIKKNLSENEVAIEMIRFRYFDKSFTDSVMYAALIISPATKTNPELVLLSNGKDMEEKWLKVYRNSIKFNLDDRNAYENFWKPIKSGIKNNAVIFLSPDGVYNQLNLETILTPDNNYVIDQNEIVLVSNTRDLIARKKVSEKEKEKNKVPVAVNNKVVLFGNPEYYSNDSLVLHTSGVKKITQLPGAEKEVKDLYVLLDKSSWEAQAFLNDKATEKSIKELNSPKVFHIATHGFFMEDMSSSGDNEGINQNRAIQSPLMRSGLLLKDGGHLIENDNVYEFNSADGILTAFEAMNLNLDNTELVVLSACETGLGKVQLGEGVYGLQRSFLVAGAKTVIMSLFKVSDEVTQELMNNFYKNWIATGDKRKALIEAKKFIKDKYKKSIYWGAFIMVGLD